MKRLLLIVLFLIFLSGSGFADDSLFYCREATSATFMDKEIGAIVFNRELYLNTDNRFANLRLVDANDTEIPYLVRRQRMVLAETGMSSGKDVIQRYPLEIVETKVNEQKKLSAIYFNAFRQPIRRLFISTASRNFRRQVVLEGTNQTTADPDWTHVASGTIFNYSAGSDHKEKLDIFFNQEHRFLKYRLLVFNEDNIPINVALVGGEGPRHEILFLHQTRNKLKVCYGGENIRAPLYDIASVLAKVAPSKIGLWEMGSQLEENVTLTGIKSKRFPKILLIVSLVLMVGVLAYLISYSVQKIEEETLDQKDQDQEQEGKG